MKKIVLLSVLLLSVSSLIAQVTTKPAFITKDHKGEVTIVFNPNDGNKGMVGATACYAHTGVITSKSDGGWVYAPEWRKGEDKYKMTKEGENWVLKITPDIYSYYGCPADEEILKLAFVFNDGPKGSKEGKTASGGDIFIDLVSDGLHAKIESPATDLLISAGDKVDFQCAASEDASLSLAINGRIVQRGSGRSLTYTHTFAEAGDYIATFSATAHNESTTDVKGITIMTPTIVKSRPIHDMGIHFSEDNTSVTLVTHAASKTTGPAKAVYVVGDFNDWRMRKSYQMYRDGNYFWLTIDNLTPGEEYAYQYWVVRSDGELKKLSDIYSTELLHPDDRYEPKTVNPELRDYPEKGDGYVTVIRPGKKAYAWSDATKNFRRPNKNNLIIYEMWVYDWAPDRSLPAAQRRLDYLQNLGVNAIELMPISEFDGNYNWGYSPNHYLAPDKAYGSEKQIKDFIDECHKRGIAVILDMVFNHATGLNPMNKLYPYKKVDDVEDLSELRQNYWFNAVAPHSDKYYEDWNHGFSETKNMFSRALQYWLTEFKVDGFRMDLSHGFCGEDCNDMVNNVKHYYNAVQQASPGAYFILEHWGAGTDDLINTGMLCWTGAGLSNAYSQTAKGALFDDAFYDANRDGRVSYAESHDEERNFYKAKTEGVPAVKNDLTVRINRVPVNVAFNVLLDGSHMLWQWQELGYDYSINSTKGSSVLDGDKNRTAIKEQPEKIGWFKSALRMKQYQRVAQLIQLRTKLAPQVFEGNPTMTHIGSGENIRRVAWGTGSDAIYVVGNFSATETLSDNLPSGTWYDYYAQRQHSGSSVTLAPGELYIFTAKPFTLPVIPDKYDFTVADGIENIPAVDSHSSQARKVLYNGTIYIIRGEEIYSIDGRRVK